MAVTVSVSSSSSTSLTVAICEDEAGLPAWAGNCAPRNGRGCVEDIFVGADVDRAADDAREACAALVGGQRLIGGVEGEGVRAGVDGRAAGDEAMGQGRAAVIGERGVEHGVDVKVPVPALPTLLPFTPLAMPPEVAASPMRLLLAG